jgi:uncharacterized protein (TIGR03089 family)
VTAADLLARELRRDPARPLLTWYDDASGARVELSVATAANWAAKLANLFVDEHDLEPGAVVGVRLPAHWQTAALLLGIWTAGACAGFGDAADAVVVVGASGTGADLELSLYAMGADLSRIAAAQPDRFVPVVPVDPQAPALVVAGRSWTHESLAAAAVHGAHGHGLDASTRVLSVLGYETADGLDAGLLVPLAAGGSVVLVTNADMTRQADRCAGERVTHTAGIDVPGLPRLC